MTLFRQLLSVILLPFVVVVLVPRWLVGGGYTLAVLRAPASAGALLAWLAGAVLVVAGATLVAWCVSLFARVGRGTLAPWDPTTRLVVVGPYRHVRNPMITGVATILAGEALLLRSPRIALWLALFVAVNHVYFVASEEPGLARRFGVEYARYRAAVPRWLPRRRAWRDDETPVRAAS